MKYKRWYDQLIQFRLLNEPNDPYCEKHHIVPKSLSGTNDKLNIIKLTAREHFIAHLLLSKIYPVGSQEHIKMCYALNRMKDNANRYKITSRRYNYIRKQHSNNMKQTKGQRCWITNGIDSKFILNISTVLGLGWYYGKTFSKEHAAKLDKARRSRDASSSVAAMRKASLGKIVSDETREKIRQGNLGKKLSAETRRRMSKSQRARFNN